MNKYTRVLALSASLGLATGCEIANSSQPSTPQTYKLERFVDPEIHRHGIGKIVCKVARREPVYTVAFTKKEAQEKLRWISQNPDVTLDTAIEIGVECQDTVAVVDIKNGTSVVVEGNVQDIAGNQFPIHALCLAVGYPVAKTPEVGYRNLSVFCADRTAGQI